MLTSQQALAEVDYARQQILPDRLTRSQHAHYLTTADRLVAIYQQGAGLTRRSLHQRARVVLEGIDDCPSKRVSAMLKLLDDGGQWEADRSGVAAKLRQQVFREAAAHHPLVESAGSLFGSNHWQLKHRIARELKLNWPQLESKLFADVIEFHTLVHFDGFGTGRELLSRYNVAQVQACLYRAVGMTIRAKGDIKHIVRLIKLSRLMHEITQLGAGIYQFRLSGPASSLRPTRRYGVAMAKLIPGLLACNDWAMSATISVPGVRRLLSLRLTSQDGLSSPNPSPQDFDSAVEADLLKKWNEVSLPDWRLTREGQLLVKDQKVFIPDFVATHASGRQVVVEIIGFWTPEYLKSKLDTLIRFRDHRVLIIAQENAKPTLKQLPDDVLHSIVWYKNKISFEQFFAELQKT